MNDQAVNDQPVGDQAAPVSDPEPRWDLLLHCCKPHFVQCRYSYFPRGYRVWWGDGTSQSVAAGVWLSHTYARPGVYTILVSEFMEPTTEPILLTDTVVIRPSSTPQFTITSPDPARPGLRRLTINDDTPGGKNLITWWELDWGDGTPKETVPGYTGAAFDHEYGTAGTFRVHPKDLARPRGWITEDVTVTFPPPDPALAFSSEGGTPAGMTVGLVATPADTDTGTGRKLRVDWGDGGQPEEITAGVKATHAYGAEYNGTLVFVVAGYSDAADGEAPTIGEITLPYAPPADPAVGE